MSSAIAMNRRVSQQEGTREPPVFQTPPPRNRMTHMNGTPVQQCWTILNFHEKRLNNIETQTHQLTHFARNNDTGKNGTGNNDMQILLQRMDRLEEENVALRKYLQQQQNPGKKSMSLEISED